MAERVTPRRRGSYGIDAPFAPAFLAGLAILYLALAIVNMTELPFEDNRFDVIVSNLAIHNISGRAGRDKAIREAVRVLRPGGQLLILDVRSTGQYEAALAKLDMNDVNRRRLGWWSRPARLVTATKPQPGN